jgi:large subunit ribosomal protein L17
VEKLVTMARDDTTHHRNLVMSRLDHEPSVARLFDVVAPRYEETQGGYTRISKLGLRRGDAAPIVLIEFVA